MALPIAETPILYGKDAENFREMMENAKNISDEEIEELKSFYEKVKCEVKIEDWQ